jgi:hypothetical protein
MMDRALAGVAMLALSIALAEGVRALPSGIAAVAVVVVGAVVAPLASGAATPLAIGTGALGALAYAALRPALPIPAGAILVTLVLAGRAVRARDAAAVVTQLGLAALGGAAATWVLLRWGGPASEVRAVAVVVATLLVSAPFAVHAEDPRVHALLVLARSARGPLRARLLRAAALRRRAVEPGVPLERAERRRVERAFRVVARLAEARLESGVTDLDALDRALDASLASIARHQRALRARWSRWTTLGIPDELAHDTERAAAETAALDTLGTGSTLPTTRDH